MLSNNGSLLIMETDTQELFVEGIKRLLLDINKERKQLGKRKLTINEISEAIGVTPDNLSGFLNYHRNYSEAKRTDLAKFFNRSYMEVIDFGRKILSRGNDLFATVPIPQFQATGTNTPPPVIDLQSEADKKHAAVIAAFKNKELALEMNQKLVELEIFDGTDGLKAASTYIDFLLNQAREKKGLAPLQQNLKNGTSNQQK